MRSEDESIADSLAAYVADNLLGASFSYQAREAPTPKQSSRFPSPSLNSSSSNNNNNGNSNIDPALLGIGGTSHSTQTGSATPGPPLHAQGTDTPQGANGYSGRDVDSNLEDSGSNEDTDDDSSGKDQTELVHFSNEVATQLKLL